MYPFSTLAGTLTLAFSSTRAIHLVTMEAGRPPALAIITRWVWLVEIIGMGVASEISVAGGG